MSTSTRSTAERGRELVKRELEARGWVVHAALVDRRPTLLIERGTERRRVRVSTRRSGSWQTSTTNGAEQPEPELARRLWVFVDLAEREPQFYVAPEAWMAQDIFRAHAAYLSKHGGTRKVSARSTHHAIRVGRIEHWHDRWDLLESGPS